MRRGNGWIAFGLFKGSPYSDEYDDIDEFNCYDKVPKDFVLARIQSLRLVLTSAPTYDYFTGEKFRAGLYDDPPFTFSTDFVRYYSQGKIGLPEEYADFLYPIYLKEKSAKEKKDH